MVGWSVGGVMGSGGFFLRFFVRDWFFLWRVFVRDAGLLIGFFVCLFDGLCFEKLV
jgi:hypothetical protein